MRDGGKPGGKSLVAVILKNLVISLLIIAAGFFAIYAIGDKITDNFWKRTDMSYLLKQRSLREEAYDKLIPGGGYRFSGYFEILDEKARVVYCSNAKKHNRYTTQMLTFIPDSKSGESIYIESMSGGSAPTYMITRYTTVDGDENISGMVLIDGDGRVTYNRSMSLGSRQIDRKTIRILFKNTNRLYLQKHQFTTASGKTRTLIYHIGNRGRRYRELTGRVTAICVAAAIVLAAGVLAAFFLRMLKIVRDPMEKLQSDMTAFGETRKVTAGDMPKGTPAEFAQLSASLAELERRLVDSDEKRRQLEREKQQILTDISHDLKTPATVIAGYAKALDDGTIPPEDAGAALAVIRRRADELAELIQAFFAYNKLETAGVKLALEEDDFCEFVREIFADRYEELASQGVTIAADIPETEMAFTFDHLLMRRAIDNIVNNAVRHGGDRVTIAVKVREVGGEIVLRIGDDGAGIPFELRDQIFTPFVTGNKARTSGEGTGLGLSIAKRVVTLHGGTIALLPAGTDGLATVFEIRLPK